MGRYIKDLYNRLVRPIFTINDTPHAIALGVSLGVFLGLTPTVGFQIILVLAIGTLIRANRIIGVLLTWISNPITFLPMYYAYYWFGGKLMGLDLWTFNTFSRKVDGIMTVKDDAGYFGIFEQLMHDIGLPLFLGSLIIASVISLPLYPWVRFVLNRHRKNGNSASNTKAQDGAGPASEEAKAQNPADRLSEEKVFAGKPE